MFWRSNESEANYQRSSIVKKTTNALWLAGKFFWRLLLRLLLLPIYQLLRWFKYQSILKLKLTPAEMIFKTPPLFFVALVIGFIAWRNVNADEIRLDSIGRNMALYRLLPPTDGLPVSIFEEEIIEGRNYQYNYSFYPDALDTDRAVQEKLNLDTIDLPAPGETELGLDQNALILPIVGSADKISKNRDGIVKYTIANGDTISSIASRFGLKITTLLWANKLTTRSMLKPGQQIVVPPLDGVVHIIKRGDNLSKLAKLYNADLNAIISVNQLSSAADIRVNQEIIIPGGRPIVAAPAPTVYRQRNQNPPARSGQPAGANAQATGDGRLLWPTTSRRISQYFNWRHYGVDIPNRIGQPIYAVQDGVVETAGWNRGGYGYYVIINHGNGMRSLYGHASELYVSPGDHVVQGQVISAIGSTGRSTGPHLHLEIRLNGRMVNPLNYIR
jgi:murein DD-endopeptidase MepM/ murein hydrolase activator NlpD